MHFQVHCFAKGWSYESIVVLPMDGVIKPIQIYFIYQCWYKIHCYVSNILNVLLKGNDKTD